VSFFLGSAILDNDMVRPADDGVPTRSTRGLLGLTILTGVEEKQSLATR
jgi:hypothetical protein